MNSHQIFILKMFKINPYFGQKTSKIKSLIFYVINSFNGVDSICLKLGITVPKQLKSCKHIERGFGDPRFEFWG